MSTLKKEIADLKNSINDLEQDEVMLQDAPRSSAASEKQASVSPDGPGSALVERLQAARLQQQRPQHGRPRSAGSTRSKAAGASQPVELTAREPNKQRLQSDAAPYNTEHGLDKGHAVSRNAHASHYGAPSDMAAPQAWALEQQEEVEELLHVLTGGGL